jgi:hypothetical protein
VKFDHHRVALILPLYISPLIDFFNPVNDAEKPGLRTPE